MVECTSTAVSIFPNAIIPLGTIGFPINLFWPIDRDTTRLEWIYYAPRLEGTDRFDPDDLPEPWRQRRRQYNQIMAEDELNMAPMHASMKSPALTGLRINYQERRIWHLHEEIDRVIGPERIPPELRLEPLLASVSRTVPTSRVAARRSATWVRMPPAMPSGLRIAVRIRNRPPMNTSHWPKRSVTVLRR